MRPLLPYHTAFNLIPYGVFFICGLGCDVSPHTSHDERGGDRSRAAERDLGDDLSLDLNFDDRGLGDADMSDAGDVDDLDMSSSGEAGAQAGAQAGARPTEPPEWDPPLSETAGRFKVRVLLDFEPIQGAWVTQGGSARSAQTDARGEVWFEIDDAAIEPLSLFASHREARTRGARVSVERREGLTLILTRFAEPDNTAYPFSDPGEPDRRPTTSQCGHCHLDINDAWFESPHRSAARNPIVYDLYTGRGSGWRDEESCRGAGGRWALGQAPGEAAAPDDRGTRDGQAWACYFDISALSAFNERCEQTPCSSRELGESAYYGGCADCHAPAQNGLSAGGHDLLRVRGVAFEYGVSCDLCHHVEEVRLAEPAGVGGRLKLQRPREQAAFTLGGGGFRPLTFGPNRDVANPRMGISPRSHFRDGSLCAGCHQHSHDDLHTREPLDRSRWPEGRLPNQSTYEEWRAGYLGAASQPERVACNSCHMPPNPRVMNSANLEYFALADVGVQGGWPRPHGETREHTWWGPRQPQSAILNLSADLTLTTPRRVTHIRGGAGGLDDEGTNSTEVSALEVEAIVTNLGAGHGLPTGEPMRHLILTVDARCGARALEAIGGDAVHELGGAVAVRAWERALDAWPEARLGDTLRVVRRHDDAYDYDGYGPFRDTTRDAERGVNDERSFSVTEKGLRREEVIGEARVIAISARGELTLDRDLLGGGTDVVYLTRDASPLGYAGRSGFTFARVLTNGETERMVPHFIARDLTRDNRLRPGAHWRSRHLFDLSSVCADDDEIEVNARLIYRPYPRWLALERGWSMWDRVIRDVSAREPTARALSSLSAYRPPAVGAQRSVTRATLDALVDLTETGAGDIDTESLSARLCAPAETCAATLITPQGQLENTLSEELNALPMLLVSLDRSTAEDASRRGEAWPWRSALIHGDEALMIRNPRGGEQSEGAPLVMRGASIIMNLSAQPLALEPLPQVDCIGVDLDDTPAPERVERVVISRVAQLWVIPPGGGALLIPRTPLNAAPLVTVGYTEHGGRSWSPLGVLAELNASLVEVEALSELIAPPASLALHPLPRHSSASRAVTPLETLLRP